MIKKRIAVFGGNNCSDDIYEQAKLVGQLLVENGVIVYCGGLGGVMEAVSRGVNESGGVVVGILPENRCNSANKYITIPVATGTGVSRNVMIANSVHGAIAISGKYGTLSEIAHTLNQEKPVVCLHSWDIKGVVHATTPEEAVKIILGII